MFLQDVLATFPKLSRPTTPANLCGLDIAALLQSNIIESMSKQNVLCWMNVFSVLEPHKNSRRLITEPRLNDVLLEPGEVDLPSMDVLCAKLFAPAAVTTDLPWWYGQFLLPPASSMSILLFSLEERGGEDVFSGSIFSFAWCRRDHAKPPQWHRQSQQF